MTEEIPPPVEYNDEEDVPRPVEYNDEEDVPRGRRPADVGGSAGPPPKKTRVWLIVALVLMLPCILGVVLVATIGVGVANYAMTKSKITACEDRLRKLGEAAITYDAENEMLPSYSGGAMWKALYVDSLEDGKVPMDPEIFLCPATEDSNRDEAGRVIWDDDRDPRTVKPLECSYAGPSEDGSGDVPGQDSLVGSDDGEGAAGAAQNHVDWGLNVLFADGSVRFIDNPKGTMLLPGKPQRLGGNGVSLTTLED